MGRKRTRQIRIGKLKIGRGTSIAVQSMTNTKTSDAEATISQIKELEKAGCEIVRVAIPDKESARALLAIKQGISIPLVADVHFNYQLGLEALNKGVDKIRINPGTIGNLEKVKEIVLKAKEKGTPIRIGVNAGSLHPKYEKKRKDLAKALVDSALEYISFLENLEFREVVVSVKSSSVLTTIKAYKMLSEKTDYPLHLGVTEAGTLLSGAVKSATGLGVLLSQGIGDTIRVSLTADPVREVQVAYGILQSLGLRRRGPELISCPTCGRCEIDLISLANEVEKYLLSYTIPVKVAVMGCVVNGPGEAKEADIGIAGGKKVGLLFKKGRKVKKVEEKELVKELIKEIKKLETASEAKKLKSKKPTVS